MTRTDPARRPDPLWWGATAFGLVLQITVAAAEIATGASPLALSLLGAGSVGLALPARYARTSAAAAVLLTAALAIDPHPWGMWMVPHLLLFRLALSRPRGEVLATAGLMAAVMCAEALAPTGDGVWFAPAQFGLLGLTAATAGTGLYLQTQRHYTAARAEWNRRERLRQEQEITHRVMAERLRIAHDLHDSVAHHIAVIGVHTGLARTTLHTDPKVAGTALAEAQSSVREVLHELQDVLRVLRTQEIGSDGVLDAPMRGAAGIPDLLDRVQRAGLVLDEDVEEQVGSRTGTSGIRDVIATLPPSLPPAVDLGLYRVIQEALTNAHKHGDGRASLTLNVDNGQLALLVTNRVSSHAARSAGGFGLIGMRERVLAAGGQLDVTHLEGVHRVRVVLPLDVTEGQNPVGVPPDITGEQP